MLAIAILRVRHEETWSALDFIQSLLFIRDKSLFADLQFDFAFTRRRRRIRVGRRRHETIGAPQHWLAFFIPRESLIKLLRHLLRILFFTRIKENLIIFRDFVQLPPAHQKEQQINNCAQVSEAN